MSVTFGIESLLTGTYSATCYETGPVVTSVPTLDEAQRLADTHRTGCTECQAYGLFVTADVDVEADLEVNLANSNARAVLTLLDLNDEDGDLSGGLSGKQFLGRVMLTLAGLPAGADVEVPAVSLSAPGQATMVDCGTRAGYMSNVLSRLVDLGTEAVRLGRDVVWG